MSRARRFLTAECAILLAASTPGLATAAHPLMQIPQVQARPHASVVPAAVDASILSRTIDGPTVATGRLLDASGRPSAGTVALIAWPNEEWNRSVQAGDTIPTPTVGWGDALGDGSFSLTVDPALVPSDYVNADGRVNLEAIGWIGDRQGSWSFAAEIATADTGTPLAAQPEITVRATMPLTATETAATTSRQATNVAPRVGEICSYRLLSTSDRWVVIGESWPYGSDRGWMKSSSSHSVTVGVAVSSTGAYGGWTASGSSTSSSGVTFEWAESTAYRDFRVGERFGKYRLWCSSSGWRNDYKERYVLSTGGYTNASLGSPPSYTNCTTVAAGLWQRDSSLGSHTVFTTGVKISSLIGIDLSVDTNYASTRILKYRLVSQGKVCGSNTVPSLAGKVKTSR
jgi:hypothetical protein